MARAPYKLTVGGTDVCAAVNGVVTRFGEKAPEPKVIKVDIPAGADLDITEALGMVAYHNGTHTIELLVTGGTEAERAERCRILTALLHGKRDDYTISWDSGYTYTGRFAVEHERLSKYASRSVVTVDRAPWKRHSRESVDVNCHPSGSYTLEGSARYHTVQAVMPQAGTTKVGGESAVTRDAAGTYTLASDLYESTKLTFTVADWLMYVSGTNMVVNDSKISISGNNAVVDSSYTVTSGNIVFADEADQHVTVRFYRWDL